MKIERYQILLLLNCVTVFVIALAPALAVKPIEATPDEKALTAQVNEYAKAFAAGDYKAIASMWAPEGTFTDIDGQVIRGRDDIQSYFKENFERFGAQKLEIVIDSIKFPSNNVAIEEGHARPLDGPAIDAVSHYSVVHVKQNNKWQMYSVTETDYAETRQGSLKDWQWLIGNWSTKPSSTKTIKIIASWAIGQKFIRCLFETEELGKGRQFAMVIIGQDPTNGRIISWHFDPSGGFGSGKWTRDGDTWIERGKSVEADGTTGSALYTLHKLDDNTFTWHSTERYLDDAKLADGDEIKISREQPAQQ
jgi:uncharacterized protein (TIGR02246 family)